MRAIFINLLIVCIFSGQSQANLPDSELEQKTVVPTAAKEKNNNNKDVQSRFERILNRAFISSAYGLFAAASVYLRVGGELSWQNQEKILPILSYYALLNGGVSAVKFITSTYKLIQKLYSPNPNRHKQSDYQPLSVRIDIDDVKTACLHVGNISMAVCGALFLYVKHKELPFEEKERFKSIAEKAVIVGTSVFLSHAALWSIDKLHYWWFSRTHKNVKPVPAKVK